MEASHKTHRPHIKVGKDEEEEEEEEEVDDDDDEMTPSQSWAKTAATLKLFTH